VPWKDDWGNGSTWDGSWDPHEYIRVHELTATGSIPTYTTGTLIKIPRYFCCHACPRSCTLEVFRDGEPKSCPFGDDTAEWEKLDVCTE